jgi:hypothetical protein
MGNRAFRALVELRSTDSPFGCAQGMLGRLSTHEIWLKGKGGGAISEQTCGTRGRGRPRHT